MTDTLRPTPLVSPGTLYTTKDMRMQNTQSTSAVNPQSGKRTSNSCFPRCSTKHTTSDITYIKDNSGITETEYRANATIFQESDVGWIKDEARLLDGVSASSFLQCCDTVGSTWLGACKSVLYRNKWRKNWVGAGYPPKVHLENERWNGHWNWHWNGGE